MILRDSSRHCSEKRLSPSGEKRQHHPPPPLASPSCLGRSSLPHHLPPVRFTRWLYIFSNNLEKMIYIFLAVPGVHFSAGFSLVVVTGGYSLVGVHGLLSVGFLGCRAGSRVFSPQ